jgi:hypothetical protein
MNAASHTFTATPAPWHEQPEAAALIRSLRANPPELVNRVEEYAVNTDRWTEFADDKRIDRLRAISNAAFLAVEREGGEAGALAFLAEPSVDDILATIGNHEVLFLGMKVPPRAPLSSFADACEGAGHPLGEAA